MSFTNTPVTRLGVVGLVAGSIIASVLDVKHYFYILIDTHIWRYRQFWRILAYQLCYVNSTEVLFAAMSLYNLRIVERMWGSRKFAVSDFHETFFFTLLISLCAVLLDCHFLHHLHHTACCLDGTAASRCWMVQLHPGWTNSYNLCYPGSVSCHGSAHVQVSSGHV
jgi:hypothetical protein